jgi:hypothetical protein
MPHYQNSVIYKLKRNDDYDDIDIYVGSTTNFKHRKNQHKTKCNNEKDKGYNLPVYQFIRANGNWDNWIMTPIEQYSCNSKKELEIRERYHIDILKSKLNKTTPGRTSKERYEKNKEQILEKYKEYYQENKEKLLSKVKEYYENNKEKLKKYYENNKEKIAERDKKYREDNKEIIREKTRERDKKYYENNKQIILEKKKEKVICDHCGCESRKDSLNKHQKTKKCINFVKKD